MRQHISPEQLLSLSQAERDVLWQWWEPALGDVMFDTFPNFPASVPMSARTYVSMSDAHQKDPLMLPLLSIGQCLAFLRSQGRDYTLHVGLYGEPIDGLWNDVRSVLSLASIKESV